MSIYLINKSIRRRIFIQNQQNVNIKIGAFLRSILSLTIQHFFSKFTENESIEASKNWG